jgi:hypothetical protein
MKNVVHLGEMINSSLIDISFCTFFCIRKVTLQPCPKKMDEYGTNLYEI